MKNKGSRNLYLTPVVPGIAFRAMPGMALMVFDRMETQSPSRIP